MTLQKRQPEFFLIKPITTHKQTKKEHMV